MAKSIITQPGTVERFSGGMTDHFIAGNPEQFKLGNNLFINDNRKLASRFGSDLHDVARPQTPEGEERIGDMFILADQLFQQSQSNVYFNDSGFTTLQGSTSNPVFPGALSTNYSSFTEWNDHVIGVNDIFSSPQKIYKDSTDVFRTNNLGLPRVTLANAIEFANDIKTEYELHRADAAQHTTSADAVNVITAADATDFDSLIILIDDIIVQYDAHEGDAELASSWLYHAAQEASDHSLASLVSPQTVDEAITRLEDIKLKYNAHDNDGTAHGVAGSHPSTGLAAPTVTATNANSFNYIYAFIWQFEYQIGDVKYIEFGPAKLVELTNGDDPSVNQNDIANLPTLVNGTVENYDTTNIKLQIYRTVNDNTTLLFVDEVANGTATYTDVSSDSDIANNPTLYTEGDVLDNDQPPKAKYAVSANDIIWLGHVKEGSVVRKNRIRHSNKSQPGSFPGSHFEDLDDEITGVGAVNIFPIYFCKNKTFRVEGFYDTTGRGFIKKREISNTVGCISQRSIISVKNGLYFASEDGFYFTDGFDVTRISGDIKETYEPFVATQIQKDRIYGAFDVANNRVLWACQSSQTSADNDTIFVGHLNFRTPSEVPFTTWTGGNWEDNYQPSSLIFEDVDLLRGDRRGYLFKHTEDNLNDPKIDTVAAASTWEVRPIIYDYQSVATDFGITDIRKWVPRMTVSMNNISNVSMAIGSMNDNSGVFSILKPIRFRENIEWGDQVIQWGPLSDSIRWNFFPVIEQWRRFVAGGLRCSYKQIRFTNDDTIIASSDVIGLATVDASAKTITLEDYPDFSWDSQGVDYEISFEGDGYSRKFTVTVVTDEIITVSDTSNFLVGGPAMKWQLSGFKKSEKINIFSYNIMFAPISMTQNTFKGATGANA